MHHQITDHVDRGTLRTHGGRWCSGHAPETHRATSMRRSTKRHYSNKNLKTLTSTGYPGSVSAAGGKIGKVGDESVPAR